MTHDRNNSKRGAFSLLETTIGMAILGLGLIMVAAIFPVALTQHRDSMDSARALDLVPKAVAMLHKRVDPEMLWYDKNLLANGFDSPWYVMPLTNMDVAGYWCFDAANPTSSSLGRDYMLNYTDLLNDNDLTDAFTPVSIQQIYANDLLSDRLTPANDQQANQSPSRVIWYGFNRKLANGATEFTAAICKQRRDQYFLMQDLSGTTPLVTPTAIAAAPQRFPVPWRVTVTRVGANGLFINNPSPSATTFTLAQLAPVGATMMVRGVAETLPPTVPAPAGQILTVSEALANGEVLVREDLRYVVSDVDVWVFPPPASGSSFSNDSPVLEWKVGL